jgi:hypothetical protein
MWYLRLKWSYKSKGLSFWFFGSVCCIISHFQGFGIWYTFPREPVGPSTGLAYQYEEAKHTAMWTFDNNVVHSNERVWPLTYCMLWILSFYPKVKGSFISAWYQPICWVPDVGRLGLLVPGCVSRSRVTVVQGPFVLMLKLLIFK